MAKRVCAVWSGSAVVSIAPDSGTSASSLLEYLVTEHPYRREIAELPDTEVDRLRGMLQDAVRQGIAAEAVYDAITRGFDRISGVSIGSPPLADDLREAEKTKQGLQALLREAALAS
jgi:hypothetical protein